MTLKRSPPPEEPIALLVAVVRREIRQLVTSRIEPFGLSTQQFWILTGIAEHPSRSQGDLAAQLRIDEATVCRVARTLTSEGWVRAVRPAEDRRLVHLALTAEGEALCRRLLPIAQTVRAAVDSALTREERAATRAALRKIVFHLQHLADDAGRGLRPPPPSLAGRRPPPRLPRHRTASP